MKKVVLLFLCNIIVLTNYGQDRESIFINEVYKHIVDTSIIPVNLNDLSVKYFSKSMSTFLPEELKTLLPEIVGKELLMKIEEDTSLRNWNQNMFDWAKIVNPSQVDTLVGRIRIVNYSEESRKEFKKRQKFLDSKRDRVYFISRPMFDSTIQYGMLQVYYVCGSGCGRSCIYLFKRENGRWFKLGEMNCFMA